MFSFQLSCWSRNHWYAISPTVSKSIPTSHLPFGQDTEVEFNLFCSIRFWQLLHNLFCSAHCILSKRLACTESMCQASWLSTTPTGNFMVMFSPYLHLKGGLHYFSGSTVRCGLTPSCCLRLRAAEHQSWDEETRSFRVKLLSCSVLFRVLSPHLA